MPDKDKKYDGKEANLRIFQERLKFLKRGQEYNKADDIPRAVECYSQYLNCLATYFGVDEKKLSPSLFDSEKDVAEMLLISHVYWDLAKAYDRSPNLRIESVRCLDQFVKFTVGFKYQYVNARMLKNFIRKRLAHNPKAFKQAFERIQVESKKCYVASLVYGESHPHTDELRRFKARISNFKSGNVFISYYYLLSPYFVKIVETLPSFLRTPTISITRLFIDLFRKAVRGISNQ
ncbi:MAG: hypothetical protein Fur0010_06950 [Bdellovibrio sp.]